jgi:TPR repeat protein
MTLLDEQHAAQVVESGDYEEAVRLLRLLAAKNSRYALLTLGWIYETGAVGIPDMKTACAYYERASAQGSDSAYLYLGRLLVREGQSREALAAFESGAKLGNYECSAELQRLADSDAEEHAAEALKAGDYEKVEQVLRPLAERKSEYALLSLGWIYETGATQAPDMEAARLYYERAAADGSAPAYYELGRLLMRQGEETQARSAFETGATKGDISCMSRLGRMMVEGRGGFTDADAGLTWLERAASQGHILAERTLLSIQERNAGSIAERLSIKRKIASLVKRGAAELLKDPHSNKMR